MSSVLFFMAFLSATYGQTDLNGTILNAEGRPVENAKVFVYQAGVRSGFSPYCPSCYPDCAKKASTDKEGSFKIPKLSDELVFKILVMADGFEPMFIERVDAKKGMKNARLKPRDLSKIDPKQIVRGKVVNEKGKPIVNAVLEPSQINTVNWPGGFNPKEFDPVAVTDENGEFVITARSTINEVSFRVEARGYSNTKAEKFIVGKPDQTVTMHVGSFIAGRLVHEGKPVANAQVGICPVSRSSDTFLGHMEIGTDDDGKFLFSNVPAGSEYYLYPCMSSVKNRGGAVPRKIKSSQDEKTLECDDIHLTPAHTVKGRVVTADGKPIPKKLRLHLGSDQAWDSQIIELGKNGEFEFSGLPNGLYDISTRINGYNISEKNVSLSVLNPFMLLGRIDSDVNDLEILFEPGEPRKYKRHSNEEFQGIAKRHHEQQEEPMRGAPREAVEAIKKDAPPQKDEAEKKVQEGAG